MTNLQKLTYAEWPNCLKLSNDTVELIVTTDVGPRILHYGFLNSNFQLFYLDETTKGMTGGDEWRPYGGHRFWHSPEIKPRTYAPDNEQVSHEWDGKILRLTQNVEPLTGMQKIIEIEMPATGPGVSVTHRLVNCGQWDITAAPWALSVLAPGGTALIPQEPFVPFPDALLPARPLTLWHYTDMTDARMTWGRDFIAMRQDSSMEAPIKIGVRNSPSWGAYVLKDLAFVKSTVLDEAATYPDFGCNWECFTDANFLELETLGPLAPVSARGGSVDHKEQWSLIKVSDPTDLQMVFAQAQDRAVGAA